MPFTIKPKQESLPRDQRLDALRGLMLIMMAVIHYSNYLEAILLDGLGYASEAEGFVILSGYVAGLSYTRNLMRNGRASIWRRAFHRAGTIYVAHAITFIAAFCLVVRCHEKSDLPWNWPFLLNNSYKTIALLGGTLLYQPAYLDILPMYVAFILFTPWILFLLSNGRQWIVLSASISVWLLAQLGLRKAIMFQCSLVLPVDFGFFDIFGWQLLFVIGLLLGAARVLHDRPPFAIHKWEWCMLAWSALLFFLFRHHWLPLTIMPQTEWLIDRNKLGPLRLCNFGVIAILLSAPQIWPPDRTVD